MILDVRPSLAPRRQAEGSISTILAVRSLNPCVTPRWAGWVVGFESGVVLGSKMGGGVVGWNFFLLVFDFVWFWSWVSGWVPPPRLPCTGSQILTNFEFSLSVACFDLHVCICA